MKGLSLFIGLLVIFSGYQNCTLYESPDRKTMNENGFPVDSNCAPYLDLQTAAAITHNASTKVAFLPPDTQNGMLFCLITVAGEATGKNSYRCSIATSNADRAALDPSTISGTLISALPAPVTGYSYFYQNSSPVTVDVITVGALSGHAQGVSCGSTFPSIPADADRDEASRVQTELVKAMVNGTD
jgi:hypothetical protein